MCHNPRRLGLFDAQGARCTTIRGDQGHRVGRTVDVVTGPRTEATELREGVDGVPQRVVDNVAAQPIAAGESSVIDMTPPPFIPIKTPD